jgi:hypothetical protein
MAPGRDSAVVLPVKMLRADAGGLFVDVMGYDASVSVSIHEFVLKPFTGP